MGEFIEEQQRKHIKGLEDVLNEKIKALAELEAENARLRKTLAYCQHHCATGRDNEGYSLCPECPADMSFPGPPEPEARK